MAQVLHLRSVNCSKLQSMFGLFAWAHGASCQVMEFLSHCSLSTSFSGTFDLLKSLADNGIGKGHYIVAFIPHSLGYDNINLSTSIFVEQTGPNLVQVKFNQEHSPLFMSSTVYETETICFYLPFFPAYIPRHHSLWQNFSPPHNNSPYTYTKLPLA